MNQPAADSARFLEASNLYLWLQNTMLTPVLFNGKLQVPMIPWEHLIAFTAPYTWVGIR